jgi:Fe-S cluster biogenesis protein NfuA
MNNSEFQAHIEKVEQLLEKVSAFNDENARATAVELMQVLMDLHGAAISRIVEVLSSSGDAGRNSLMELADDSLICGLLVLYGVHPVVLEERVLRALEELRPQLQKLGMTVELTSAAEGTVRVNVQSSRPDTHSAESVRAMIERSIREAAPEVAEITIGGLQAPGFVPVNMIQPAMKYETGEAV